MSRPNPPVRRKPRHPQSQPEPVNGTPLPRSGSRDSGSGRELASPPLPAPRGSRSPGLKSRSPRPPSPSFPPPHDVDDRPPALPPGRPLMENRPSSAAAAGGLRSPSSTARVPLATPVSTVQFGRSLQQAHDAINKRHDEELRALESFRMHVFHRAKADREYAQELSKINGRANRTLSNLTQASPIVQAWSSYVEVCSSVQKVIAEGASTMSGTILLSIDQIIKDKRGAKKVFDGDCTRMEKECHGSAEEVQSLRREYDKLLKSTETYKRKLESANPKDLERYRRKFVTHATHLHNCHNEYSLSVLNANSHQEHWQMSLHPFCLDTLQQRMELQIKEWKDALSKYAEATDFTQVYQNSFNSFYEMLKQVEMDQEYVQFVKDNQQDIPSLSLFEFDEALLKKYCSPSVAPGKIVMNNLTGGNMRSRLEVLDKDLEQHNRDITQKQAELQGVLSESDSTLPSSPGSPQLPKHVQLAQLQSQIKELQSFVDRKTSQAQIIHEASDALGDQPAPLFDPLGEGVEVKDMDTSTQSSSSAPYAKQSMGGKMQATLFRGMKGFKGIGKKLKGKSKKDPDTLSSGYARTTFPGLPEQQEAAEDSDSGSEINYEDPTDTPIEDEEWYYGDIDRRLAESKCKNHGDYLVRFSSRAKKYVLTCNFNGSGKHFMISCTEMEDGTSKYRFEGKAFAKVRDLIEDHVTNSIPITKMSGAIITSFVSRYDKWALRHDDVKVGRKIGKGAFGDVFESTLRNGQRVAVKTCRSSEMQDLGKFLQEADILKQYDHPNIVRLIGVCAEKDPVYIVMELMPGGALLDFLRKKGVQQTLKKLCWMAIEACKGMEYLEGNNCIHRDLAARNCLVGDNDVVKIADFGMSREDEGGIYIVQSGTRNIPIKWTAPEGLNFGKYTSASDVWSFGVLLWEVFSYGSAPYPGMANQEARSQIEMGYRMNPPMDCPSDLHAIMSQCWQYEPEERPNFSQILEMLNRAYEKIP